MSDRVRAATIGSRITARFAEHPRHSLVGVCDVSLERAEAIAARSEVPAYADHPALRPALITSLVSVLLLVTCSSGPSAGTTPPSSSSAAAAASSPTALNTPTAPATSSPYPMPTGAPLTWISPSPSVTCREELASSIMQYQSGTRSYSGKLFRPTGNGPFPAVLVLHSGIGLVDHELAYGQWLADQGYVALAPDYFAPVSVTASTVDTKILPADTVREDLARAVDCLRKLAYVDKTRIGAVGFSLGGYFALTLGTRDDVRAVIAYYLGACDQPYDAACAVRYPVATVASQMRAPVLLLHGQSDTTSPFAFIRATQDILSSAGKNSQLVPYAGVRHGFDFGTSRSNHNYDRAATADAQARSLAFLQAMLR